MSKGVKYSHHKKGRLSAVFLACFGWGPAKFPQEMRWGIFRGPRKTYVLWGKYYSSAKYLMVRTIWEV